MKKQSVDVLDEADAFERKMRWIEFCAENEFPYLDGEWNPGDPLFEWPDYSRGEQYVRFMIQEIQLPGYDGYSDWTFNSDHICKECDSRWSGYESKCWFCELENIVKKPDFSKTLAQIVAENTDLARQQLQVYALQTYNDGLYYNYNNYYNVNEFQNVVSNTSNTLAPLEYYLRSATFYSEHDNFNLLYHLSAETYVGGHCIIVSMAIHVDEIQNSNVNYQELLKEKLREEIVIHYPELGENQQ